ncbi:MAG: ABC transporter substrate-binding protein [Bdellovibrionota bacterium]|nr:MAG: ABC transporter substrate-binding protein [Bdellovibrionota bacterium]
MRAALCIVLLHVWALACPEITKADPFSPQRALKVGVIQSLTGIAAEDGKTTLQALQLAANELNRDGVTRVELLVQDDGTEAKNAVTAYKKLAASGVDAVVGPTWSFTMNSVIPLAAQDQIPIINTSTIPECLDLKKSGGAAFSTAISVAEHARIFGEYLEQKPTTTSIIIHTNNSWGEAQRVAYRQVLNEQGITVLREIPGVNFDANDWRASLPALKALQPGLWVLLVNRADLDTLIRQMRALGITAPVYASYHFADTLRLHNHDKVYGDVCYSQTFQPTPSEVAFAAKFKAAFGSDPQAFADNTYDTLFLLYRAFERSLFKEVSLREALMGTTYSGVVGEYRFDSQRTFSIGKGLLECVPGR